MVLSVPSLSSSALRILSSPLRSLARDGIAAWIRALLFPDLISEGDVFLCPQVLMRCPFPGPWSVSSFAGALSWSCPFEKFGGTRSSYTVLIIKWEVGSCSAPLYLSLVGMSRPFPFSFEVRLDSLLCRCPVPFLLVVRVAF